MRRAGRPVIPARRSARAAAAFLCAAVAVVTVLSGTGLNGAPLTGTAQASTTPTAAAHASTTPTGAAQASATTGAAQASATTAAPQASTAPTGAAQAGTAPTGPAGAQPVPVGGPQLAGRGVIVNYPAHGGRRLPHVPASAYVIADAGTGQVLAAKDPHGWYRPASTLKVLTAITLMPALSPDATVIASHRAAVIEPSKVGLITGDSYRVSDLFKALLMISANDAAIALVQATGSYAKGMAMMNAEAHHLQADDTVAVTPNGLDARDQHVSAYDEALFARQALAIPAFMRDERLLTFRFPLRPHRTRHHRHRMVTLYSQNTMLTTFRGDLGGKIGWTRCLMGLTFPSVAKLQFSRWAA